MMLAMLLAGEAVPQVTESPARSAVVKAWIKSGPPAEKVVRPFSSLRGFDPDSHKPLSRFGGSATATPLRATGFFRTQKLGRRWWLIDPEGYPFLHVAVNSVRIGRGPTFREAFAQRFADEQDWAEWTVDLLRAHGFNGTGSWSDDKSLRSASPPPVYTRNVSFMGSFGRKLGVAKQGAGHQLYTNQLIPVFHPEFPLHCQEVAKQLASTKDDPCLLGIFSDNELQRNRKALELQLDFPANSPERRDAEAWLRQRQDGDLDPEKITDEDRRAYVAHMFATYFCVVKSAIRQVDPNHLYLGPRLHGWDKNNRYMFEVAGRHLDVIAVNVYGVWTPAESVQKWVRWSGKPVLITEFYAKGQDSGMPNQSGAGWTVPTQRDRGLFYQHFTLSLLESRDCVGWHYFKYADNDLRDTSTDPSNRDSNKGILTARYEPWEELLEAMTVINRNVYGLAAYFDEN